MPVVYHHNHKNRASSVEKALKVVQRRLPLAGWDDIVVFVDKNCTSEELHA